MKQDTESFIRHTRNHICLECKRPVQSLTVARASRGHTCTVQCHGDRQVALVTESDLEDERGPLYWFERREMPPQRIDLHVHFHFEGATDAERD